jgi:hypothetical protein
MHDIAAVAIEQHEYLPMRRGQRARLANDHNQMSAPINVAGSLEIVGDGDLLAASVAQRHRSSTDPRLGSLHGQFFPVTIYHRVKCRCP